MKWMLLLVGCLMAMPVQAEPNFQLRSATARRAADVASWVTVAAVTAGDVKASWDCPDRRQCFLLQGARVGAVYAAVFAVKFAVHRARPCKPDCGSDNPDLSFFSGHTALAFTARGGPRLALMLPLAISTGGLRVAAGKHWATDTLAGAGAGLLASLIR